jgi:SAM-dependent methyltransferase
MGCPICGRRFRAFKPFGGRANAQCRGCGALERHRALWLLLQDRPALLRGSILHLAPEAPLEKRLRAMKGIDYATADVERTDVDIRADVTRLPFDDARWDLVICSHVLEHVVDDRAAMRELRRVLRSGGAALVLVPGVPGMTETLEDPAATTPQQRLETFGQPDHVRIYARDDLTARLRAAGFDVEVVTPLEPFDRIWVAKAGGP